MTPREKWLHAHRWKVATTFGPARYFSTLTQAQRYRDREAKKRKRDPGDFRILSVSSNDAPPMPGAIAGPTVIRGRRVG